MLALNGDIDREVSLIVGRPFNDYPDKPGHWWVGIILVRETPIIDTEVNPSDAATSGRVARSRTQVIVFSERRGIPSIAHEQAGDVYIHLTVGKGIGGSGIAEGIIREYAMEKGIEPGGYTGAAVNDTVPKRKAIRDENSILNHAIADRSIGETGEYRRCCRKLEKKHTIVNVGKLTIPKIKAVNVAFSQGGLGDVVREVEQTCYSTPQNRKVTERSQEV